MLRPPTLPQLQPDIMALAATRPELLQALLMQQQQQQRPQMMMQPFGGPTGLPPGMNPASMLHAQAPSNTLLYQMQSQAHAAQQQQQARLLEEQKRHQQQQVRV